MYSANERLFRNERHGISPSWEGNSSSAGQEICILWCEFVSRLLNLKPGESLLSSCLWLLIEHILQTPFISGGCLCPQHEDATRRGDSGHLRCWNTETSRPKFIHFIFSLRVKRKSSQT